MRAKMIALLVVFGAAAVASLTCSPVYLLRAGIEEGKILSRRRPIPDVMADPLTAPDTRRKLELVLRARTFAAERLGLDAGESYTTYSWIERDTLALVLSAARRDRFEEHTWWFPIVGRVPYKGFFSLDEARDAAEALQARGYDTYLRPTSAFSTLGWFNDPLLSTVIESDDVDLVSTVVHELTHNTVYVASRIAFNESFANFVGSRGAIEYFCGVEGDTGERCRRARDRWADNVLFGRHIQRIIAELEHVYGRDDLSAERRVARRDSVLDRAARRFRAEVEPELRTPAFRRFADIEIDNARLIAWRLYYDRLHRFDAVYDRYGGDLTAAVDAIARAAEARPDAPFEALERLAGP